MDGNMNDKKNRFAEKSEAELLKMHTKGMALIEGVWGEIVSRYADKAGGDRTSANAQMEGEARIMKQKALLFHYEADLLATKRRGFPMARNER